MFSLEFNYHLLGIIIFINDIQLIKQKLIAKQDRHLLLATHRWIMIRKSSQRFKGRRTHSLITSNTGFFNTRFFQNFDWLNDSFFISIYHGTIFSGIWKMFRKSVDSSPEISDNFRQIYSGMLYYMNLSHQYFYFFGWFCSHSGREGMVCG